MKTIIAKNSCFADGDLRLDASFHLSEGNITKKYILNSPYQITNIGYYSDRIFYGGRAKRHYVTNREKGLPFIGSSDMLKTDLSNIKCISKELTVGIDSFILKEGWILISRSGTVGNTAFANKDFEGKAASEHIIRVVPNSKVYPGFLYAYLSSKYGYSLLTQGIFGAVIQHIEPEHIENIPIPIFPSQKQEEIHNMIVEAADLRVEANRLLEEGIMAFENEIGISNITLSSQVGTINVNQIYSMSRLDAQFQLIKKRLGKEKNSGLQYENIMYLSKNISVGSRSKRNYVSNGVPFLSSSDMMLFNPKRYARQISPKTGELSSLLVSKDTILISRSGTVGNVILVGNDLTNTAISEHALHLEIDKSKIDPEYVFCYLKTKQGQVSMQSSAFGSVIITLNENLIGSIEIPILDDKYKIKIVDKIKQYVNKVDLATSKESQAIHLIEKEIDSWQQS
jgi:type I restriction enzyme S subunit